MARTPTFKDEEILDKALRLQEENPLFSEGAICGLMRVNREYLSDRSKSSASIKELRGVMAAIRQGAWEQAGIELIKRPSKDTNPIVFIWMSRNVLGWRNDPAEMEAETKSAELKEVTTVSSADYLNVLKSRAAKETK